MDSTTTCTICLCQEDDDDKAHDNPLVKVWNCCHKFHVNCAACWLEKSISCPICRVDSLKTKDLRPDIMRAFQSHSQSHNHFNISTCIFFSDTSNYNWNHSKCHNSRFNVHFKRIIKNDSDSRSSVSIKCSCGAVQYFN